MYTIWSFLYRAVQECLRQYGYHIVNRVMYGDDGPLFQIDTIPPFSLKVLIAQLPNIDTELKTALRGNYEEVFAVCKL